MKRIDSRRKARSSGTAKPSALAEPLTESSFASSDALKIPGVARRVKKGRLTRSLRRAGDAEPVFFSEPLISYKLDPKLARDETVLITVKTTQQMHKNDRQEEQMKRPTPEVFGREVARRYVHGFVAAFPLRHDRFSWNLSEVDWAFSAVEPYALEACGNKMALTGGNYAWLIDLNTGERKSLEHPWLSQVHTAQFSADGTRLLVASAGFDAIFEFDVKTCDLLWEWFAWEHGFEKSQLGHHVVRSRERSELLRGLGEDVILVDDPRKYPFGIPTRLSPAHLNSAAYDSDGNILVTLFHQGAGIIVDKATGGARTLISGMVNPHKLARRKNGDYFVSDTRRGKLIFVARSGQRAREIALANLPGLERSPQLSEFLQNTTELKMDLFAAVDIHRNTVWLIDVKRRRYRGIKFPPEWSTHDIASVEREKIVQIGRLVGNVFGKVEAAERLEKIIRHFSPDGREDATLTLAADGRNRGLNFQM